MSYGSQTDFEPQRPYKVPFAEVTAPMRPLGEAIYLAVAAVARSLHEAVRAHRVRARERSVVDALAALDDRTLKDIGVPRSEIRTLARAVAKTSGDDYRSLYR